MFALTPFDPFRRNNLASLDMVRHVHFAEGVCTILISKDEAKTCTGLEFELPALLLPYLDGYCRLVRPRLNSDSRCTGLWMSAKGGELSYAAVPGIFAHAIPRSGSDFGSVRTMFRPRQPPPELLADRDGRTTTVHYNRARNSGHP
jgi:hypothetical protein